MLLKQKAVKKKKKYCVHYVSEHLKYCAQINEYWLNKNVCLNIVLNAVVEADAGYMNLITNCKQCFHDFQYSILNIWNINVAGENWVVVYAFII